MTATQNVLFNSIGLSGDNLFLGSYRPSFTPDWSWNGKLDDIRIYNRALTQSEVTFLATH